MYDCINLDRNAIIYKYYYMPFSISGPIHIHFQKCVMQNPIQIGLSSDIICFEGIRKICMFCQGTHPLQLRLYNNRCGWLVIFFKNNYRITK